MEIKHRKELKNPKKFNIDVSIMVMLGLMIIFFGRCFYIISNSVERGGFAYVEMLNYGLPIVKQLTFEEEAYMENEMSLKNVALEAIGIKDMGPQSMINRELPFVKNMSMVKAEIPEYGDFTLDEGSVAKYDKKDSGSYDESLKAALKNSKPRILILNTHTTENYVESKKFTDNKDYNVVGVTEVITKELKEKYGIEVIHDKTKHDVSYNSAYKKTRETIKKYVDKYGNNFDLVIDIHRDGARTKAPFYTKLNGEDLARINFVNSRSAKYFAENDKVAREMLKISDRLFKGFARQSEPITYNHGTDDFAQEIAKNSILIEVGSNLNTTEEARNSGKYIARIIAEYIKSIKK